MPGKAPLRFASHCQPLASAMAQHRRSTLSAPCPGTTGAPSGPGCGSGPVFPQASKTALRQPLPCARARPGREAGPPVTVFLSRLQAFACGSL